MRSILRIITACIVLMCYTIHAEEPQTRTAIIGAMDVEIALLKSALTEPKTETYERLTFITGTLNGQSVVVLKTGIGKVNAAMTVTLLLQHYKPSAVIFTGIAGAIHPDLNPGDIVIGTKTAQHDYGDILEKEGLKREGTRNGITGKRNPLFYPADPKLLEAAQRCTAKLELQPVKLNGVDHKPVIMSGSIVTGDLFIASSTKKDELRKELQADAVEMEGAAVAQICFQQEVPCLIIRSLSDRADGNAVLDEKTFFKIAAGNSAKLVLELMAELQKTK